MDKLDFEQIGQMLDNYIGGIIVFAYNTDTAKVEYRYVNEGFFRMLSVSSADGLKLLKNITRSLIPDDLPILRHWIKDVCDDNGSVETEIRYVTLDGQLSWVVLRGNLCERKGKVNTIICSVTDITERMLIQEEMQSQFKFMNTLMDIDINFDYNVRTDVCEIRVGKDWKDAGNMIVDHYLEQIDNSGVHPDDRKIFLSTIKRAMKKPMQESFEYRAVAPYSNKQDYRWFKCNVLSVMGVEGYVTHVLGLISDINEQKIEEIELKLRADKDSLTGLLNKGATHELIEKNLMNLEKNGLKGALVILDVDDFKNINDTHGHIVGDDVIASVGKVLNKNFKGMDVVGRVGGDEFMILMYDIKEEQDVETMANRLQKQVKEKSAAIVRDMVSLSIGIALCPENGWDFQKLYELADQALYDAKKNGKARYSVYHK